MNVVNAQPVAPDRSRAKRRALWVAVGLLSLVAIAIVARWGVRRFTHSITKDAFIESHLINLAPQVSGTVVEVFVQEQDLVTKGQLLARIDPSTYQREVELDAARLAVAEAALAKAKVDLSLLTEEVPKRVTIAEKKLAVSRDTRKQADESRQMIGRDTDEAVRAAQQAVEAAKAAFVLGKEDFDRYEALFKEGSVSERRFQEATKVYRATEAEVRGAEAKLGQAEANRTQVAIADQALKAADHQTEEAVASVELAQLGNLEIEAGQKEVEQRERAVAEARRALELAQTNLGYTEVLAPYDGVIARKWRHLGDYAHTGDPVFSMYNPDLLYVTVQLEETLLEGVAPGNYADLHVDAYSQPFRGRVLWVGSATSSNFSLIPRDISSGEFTYVVQRVPTRIAIERDERWNLLKPGMSVTVAIEHGAGDADWAREALEQEAKVESLGEADAMTAGNLAWQLIAVVREQRRVMLAVLPAVAIAMLNSTMLDLPRSDFIDALDTDRYRIGWIDGAYMLGAAVGMALTQFFGRLLGLRMTFVGAMTLFACAAGAGATVSDIVWMTPLRLLQGLGMGLAISTAMVLIWQAFPRHKELAMAIYAMVVYVPSLAGATVGGLLTTWFGWRSIFLVNLPIGLLMALVAWRLLADDRPRVRSGGVFDWMGLALLASTVVGLSVVLFMGQYWGWFTSPFFLPWFFVLVAATTAFTLWGVFAPAPLINLRPLAIRHFALGLGIKVLYSVNLYALIGLLAGYMIDLRGYQWYQAALVILPGLVAMVASLAVGTWLGTDGNRKLRMFLGLGGMAAATLALSNVDVYTAKTWQAAVLCCWGAGAGLVCGPGLLTMFEGLSNEETLASAGVFNIARSLPAFLAGGLLVVLVTQHADENFDWIRLKIRDNRPVVEQSMRQSHAHMIARGSPHDLAKKQTHAMLGQWIHANARAYALQDALRVLALAPLAGMLLVLAVRIPSVEAARLRGRAMLESQSGV